MNSSRFSEFRIARRFRALNRSLQILLSISLICALNFVSAKYFKRFDLTTTGTYSLAPESKAYLRELTEPVQIIVAMSNNPDSKEMSIVRSDLEKMLREYEYYGIKNGEKLVTVEFVDIYKQRKRAQELQNIYDITKNDQIIVASGDRSHNILLDELYDYDDGIKRGFSGERAFTSALLDVSAETTQKIYFLVGHGEMRLDDVDPLRGLSQLESFLRERNFELATIDLAVEDAVPADCSLIIAPSPQAGLLPEEVEKLRRYMSDRNGRMLVLVDPGRRHGMDDLFYDWGILTDDMAVLDPGPDFKAQGGDLIIRRFAKHPITDLLIEYQITALFGLPRPVRTDPASLDDERLQVTQIIGTSDQSWGERDYRSQGTASFDSMRDLSGPISIGTVATRSAGSELGISIPGGRIVVFGNSDFIANNSFSAFGNQTLFINSINWALDRKSLLNIPTRPLQSHQIVMSESGLKQMLAYFTILPAVAAGFGLFTFLLRRR